MNSLGKIEKDFNKPRDQKDLIKMHLFEFPLNAYLYILKNIYIKQFFVF